MSSTCWSYYNWLGYETRKTNQKRNNRQCPAWGDAAEEQGRKVLDGGDIIGKFRNFSRDFDFGVNFMLFEKKDFK